MAMTNPNHHSDSSRDIKLDGVDFISSLPDAILHDILSYIPTKFAIRTSLLSKRWKPVWHGTPSISIDCDEEDPVDSINKTLSSYSALKIKSFYFRISHFVGISEQNPFHRWIELAMSRNTENLSIELERYHSFPDFFYRNSSIKQLSLSFDGMYTDLQPQCTVSWRSLRNLSLDNIVIPDESIANIISGCPMLETLILSRCDEIHHLDLSRSLNLTRLEIIGVLHILGPEEIVAPHIHYLSVTNVRMPPTLVDVSSLTEANFNLNYSRYETLEELGTFQDMVLKLLAQLQNVEKLTIGTVALQIISLAELHGVTFPQFKIKSLTVETMPVRSVIPGVIRLLQNSPGLKKMTVYTTEDDEIIPDKDLEIYLRTQGLNNDVRWNIPKKKKSEHVASFMKVLLRKTETLETMVLLRVGGYLNATEYQILLSKNKNFKIIQ